MIPNHVIIRRQLWLNFLPTLPIFIITNIKPKSHRNKVFKSGHSYNYLN